jgi:enoyl-CoA hydratase
MVKKKMGMPLFRYEEPIPTDDFETIVYEKDGPIGRIVLTGPEKRNALDYYRLCEIAMALQAMEMDNDIRVIIIKGAGPSFCSGIDMAPGGVANNNPNPNDPRAALGYADVGDPPGGVYIDPDKDMPWYAKAGWFTREVYYRIFDLQKPVISQIHGYCLGSGTHLAGFCDLRVVAEDAQIGFPVVKTFTPEMFQYEIWLMGLTRATRFLMTGDNIDGKTAYDWGWASYCFPTEKLEEETEDLARKIALSDPVLLMITKRSIHRQIELMGFKTGMSWSMDLQMVMGRRSGPSEGRDFWQMASEEGLRAAVDWRNERFEIDMNASSDDER